MKRVVVLLAISIAIFVLVSCGSPSSHPPVPASHPNVIEVTAAQLYTEYEANEVRANALYEGKTLRVTGVIISIGEEIMGHPYIVLGSGEEFEVWGVQCLFDNKEEVIPLDRGQTVAIEGKCEGYLINVLLEHCSVQQLEPPMEPSASSKAESVAPKEKLSALCSVTSWDQEYYEYLDEWGLVEVHFEVWNTGNVEIDYYEVYLEAWCHGSTYSDWTNGTHVGIGKIVADTVHIDTANKKATSVTITDWKLEHY